MTSQTEWSDVDDLRDKFKQVCQLLISKDKLNFVVRNCSERMIKIFDKVCEENKIKVMKMKRHIQGLNDLKTKRGAVQSHSVDDNSVELSDKMDDFFGDITSPKQPTLGRRATMAPKFAAGKLDSMDENLTRFKSKLITEIREVIEEIDSSRDSVTQQGAEHISKNDLILTYGSSGTLTNFLIDAAEQCSFEVIVCETAPKMSGH